MTIPPVQFVIMASLLIVPVRLRADHQAAELHHRLALEDARRKDWDGAIRTLAQLSAAHGVELVSIGNGTASRETDTLVADLMARHPELKLRLGCVLHGGKGPARRGPT